MKKLLMNLVYDHPTDHPIKEALLGNTILIEAFEVFYEPMLLYEPMLRNIEKIIIKIKLALFEIEFSFILITLIFHSQY